MAFVPDDSLWTFGDRRPVCVAAFRDAPADRMPHFASTESGTEAHAAQSGHQTGGRDFASAHGR
jgi:hypothetical protein